MEEISRNLFMITVPMPFRLKHVHVFALTHDDRITLFDTGLNTPETVSILEESLRAIRKTVRDIKRIFITHHHIDHCGMAGRIKAISGAKIHVSDVGREVLSVRTDEAELVRLVRDFCLLHGLPESITNFVINLFLAFKTAASPFETDRCFQADSRHVAGETEFQAIATPGHTRDHVSYYFPKEGILLSGDHVLPEITPNLSPDLFAPDFRPLRSFLDSLTRIETLPVQKVYPAHGDPFSNLAERIEEMKSHHVIRKGLALESVTRGSRTTFEVSRDIFGDDLPEFDRFLALNETYVHLVELVHEGAVKEQRNKNHILYDTI
ncbi:MAG: MBL fold metallo-hydrolase [Deltaproteobacteria bacterium]|nr:MBL fold metallo-hydrolase [Deltaproteobacteria bacterium]